MPVIIAVVVVSLIGGFAFSDRRKSVAVAVGLGLLTLVAFIWAVADRKGDDPWWEILIGAAGALLCVAAAFSGSYLRQQFRGYPARPEAHGQS